MFFRELSSLWRHAVPARITTEPKATTEAFHGGEMELMSDVILRLVVPHPAILTLEAIS
jgi:hypothetical protein